MAKKLFLLDGMALVYRAHFAFATRPIFSSKGVNTSALYGFTQTLLDILKKHEPTHIGVAFDTSAPTQRHVDFPEYKAQREEMPEDLSAALPHVRKMIEAFNIPVLIRDGFEADDIIGTLVHRAEKEGFESYMVTPDKDFGQLVSAKTFLYKPARMGDAVDVLGLPEILLKWGIERPEQVIDVLALWGDTSDNIPGVPGIGEKTAIKLISQYGSVENLLAHTGEQKGKLKENLEGHRHMALLSKKLATIILDVPLDTKLDDLKVQPLNEAAVRALCVEFEFNAIGRRLFGEDFKAGRGFEAAAPSKSAKEARDDSVIEEFVLESETQETTPVEPAQAPAISNLKTITDVSHEYHLVTESAERKKLIKTLRGLKSFCFDTETTGLDVKEARLIGIAFSFADHTGYYVAMPAGDKEAAAALEEFRPVFEDEAKSLNTSRTALVISAGIIYFRFAPINCDMPALRND